MGKQKQILNCKYQPGTKVVWINGDRQGIKEEIESYNPNTKLYTFKSKHEIFEDVMDEFIMIDKDFHQVKPNQGNLEVAPPGYVDPEKKKTTQVPAFPTEVKVAGPSVIGTSSEKVHVLYEVMKASMCKSEIPITMLTPTKNFYKSISAGLTKEEQTDLLKKIVISELDSIVDHYEKYITAPYTDAD